MTDFHPNADASMAQAARDWIMRLASGDISESELAAYRRWAAVPAHASVFEHELALWRSLGAIGQRLSPEAPLAATRSHRPAFVGMAIAASLALVLAGPEMLLRMRADHRTNASVEKVVLPDGSRVVLDARSAIAVSYDSTERRIELLRGRAWFDVAHQKRTFRVEASGGVIEDIGTAFAVSDEAGRGEAAVTQGAIRLRLRNGGGPWLTLRAGQRASWAADAAVRNEKDQPTARIAAWRGGDVLLDDVPVRAAVREIARYRSGPTIAVGALDSLPRVTAIMRANRSEEGLDALAASARLDIFRLPGGIAIVRPAR